MTEKLNAADLIDQQIQRSAKEIVEFSISADQVGPAEMATFIGKMRDQFQKVMAYIDETGMEDASSLARDMNDAFVTLGDLVSKVTPDDGDIVL